MKVIFDYQIFYLQRYGGISRYFCELAKSLHQIKDCNPFIVAPFTENEYVNSPYYKDVMSPINPVLKVLNNIPFYKKSGKLNEQEGKKYASGKNILLHQTYYTHRFETACPKVITIHDMIYELFNKNTSEELNVIHNKKTAILQADAIIAVSENTKRDLVDFYPEVKNKISVVYHGVDQSTHPDIEPYKHHKPFLLHVGNRGWYKNFEELLEVYGSDSNLSEACDLFVFGGGDINDKEKQLVNHYQLQNKVYFVSGKDKALISLYKSARALVYISNYEGFGMPVLEAMALSCPVITSNTSSLPEVYGTAALAINPGNKEELLKALTSLVFDTDLRGKLIAAGLKRAAEFTWEKCAIETYGVYKNLI